MLTQFLTHCSHLLDDSGKSKYLLAFSGGMDSVCLGDLLIKAQIPFEVAHVNFGLRGQESEGDQSFAEEWARTNSLTIHVHQANAQALAEEKGISIQMAARDLRYAFFEQIRAKRNLQGVLLAHHEDDQIETILLNLLRGTGIEGIYGMADKKGWLIRPLLSFSRKTIETYILENNLSWREDSSNQKTDYKRNKIRHLVLPHLLELEPDSRKNLLSSFARLKDTGKAFQSLFENWKTQHLQVEKEFQFLPFTAFQNQTGAVSLLYFWLRTFGFNSEQAEQIQEASMQRTTGKIFQSPSHQVNLDRNGIFLTELKPDFEPITLNSEDEKFSLPEGEYQILKVAIDLPLDKNPANAQLDADLLQFPLEIRTWEEGDRFNPLGMNNQKKVSDFLIDAKIPLFQKQSVKVLVSGDEIAWIIGFRIADWAKRTATTQRVIYFKKS